MALLHWKICDPILRINNLQQIQIKDSLWYRSSRMTIWYHLSCHLTLMRRIVLMLQFPFHPQIPRYLLCLYWTYSSLYLIWRTSRCSWIHDPKNGDQLDFLAGLLSDAFKWPFNIYIEIIYLFLAFIILFIRILPRSLLVGAHQNESRQKFWGLKVRRREMQNGYVHNLSLIIYH